MLAIAFTLSALAITQAVSLRVNADLAQLLPDDYASVNALNKLRDTVGAESTVDVAIQSPSFEANKRFAEALIPEVMALRQKDGSPGLHAG